MAPSVGRIVHYYPAPGEQRELQEVPGQPLAAIVATVHSPSCVNLTVFDANGGTHSRTSVPFFRDRRIDAGTIGFYATWPPQSEHGQ